MKKIVSFLMALIIVLSFSSTAFAEDLIYNIDASKVPDVPPAKIGINIDDSVCSTDGTLTSNLIENGSFENKDNGWIFPTADFTYGNTDFMSQNNPTYNVVSVEDSYLLQNNGFDTEGGMGFVENEKYDFSCFIKNIDFDGTIKVWLNSESNSNNITKLATSNLSNYVWSELTAELTATATEVGNFSILFEGKGSFEIDCVSLTPQGSYGYNDENWQNANLNQNVVTAIQNLNPSFIRYSFGETNWKDTIGEQNDRVGTTNTNAFGYHEFLQLCVDLNAVAIPCISTRDFDTDSNDFANYKQDILDMIEYSNAKWETSYYGMLRSTNGRADSFELSQIQLIDGGTGYNEIKEAIEKEYPEIEILGDADIKLISSADECTLEQALSDAKELMNSEIYVAFNCAFSKDIDAPIMLNADSIAYTPSYFAQMLFANNIGSNFVDKSSNEELNQNVVIDQENHIVFINIINTGSSKSINYNISGIGDIASASIQQISNGYTTAKNDFDSQYIAPTCENIEFDGNTVNASIESNSVNVIRITYDNNDGNNLYQLPDTIDYETDNYIPSEIIIILIALAVTIPIGSVIGYVLYKKVISKKKKNKRTEDD